VKPVGVTQRSLPPNEFGEHRDALDTRWPPFLAACGLVGVPLPNLPWLAVATARELGLGGVLFTGGDDLAAYGGRFPHRDETERELLRWALGLAVPVFGVCRGMQVLVHAYGGRLEPVRGHVATRHEVRTGGRVRRVNSFHRAAARSVPAPLEVTATCGDVVEAVRDPRAGVAGIMWHPEREARFDEEDIAIVSALFGSTP
jgi:gamma-glutamyl-gamma-aminobutyrate hydrolase PuuD